MISAQGKQAAEQEQMQADFSALLAGDLYDNDSFELGQNAYIWSSTEYDAQSAGSFNLNFDDNIIYLGENDLKEYGYSIRCIKDQ